MAYRLYWYPGTCSRIPYVALEEIGAPFETVLEDRMAGGLEYMLINPKGSVPALIVDGWTLTENVAIQTYLARRHLMHGFCRSEMSTPKHGSSRCCRGLRPASIRWFDSCASPGGTAMTAKPTSRCGQRRPHYYKGPSGSLKGGWATASGSFANGVSSMCISCGCGSARPGRALDGSSFPQLAAHATRCEERPSVARVLEHEERELAALRSAGKVPDWVLPFQAGRAPLVAH